MDLVTPAELRRGADAHQAEADRLASAGREDEAGRQWALAAELRDQADRIAAALRATRQAAVGARLQAARRTVQGHLFIRQGGLF